MGPRRAGSPLQGQPGNEAQRWGYDSHPPGGSPKSARGAVRPRRLCMIRPDVLNAMNGRIMHKMAYMNFSLVGAASASPWLVYTELRSTTRIEAEP